jgi:nicotinate-nucleotide pyrophosphorylase (carboxylating)
VQPFHGDEPLGWTELCDTALLEDIGLGDVTRFAVPEEAKSDYYIEAQGPGILCGIGFVHELLVPLAGSDEDEFGEWHLADGTAVESGDKVYSGRFNTRELLRNERTSLNFLMFLSGIATHVSKFVKACEGTKVKILDTRKTAPGLRHVQKYAVRCGGGHNHRMNLSDGILIKDNHVRAAGGIRQAITRVRTGAPLHMKIEVECSTVAQVDRALSNGAEIIMLDNMAVAEARDAVSICEGRAILEVSGGISIENIREYAETGVDYISVGALTHSSIAVPFHLEVQ